MMNAHMLYMPMFPKPPIQYDNMPFMPNPYFGAFNMLAIPFHNGGMNHVYANHFSMNSANNDSSGSNAKPEVKKHNSEEEVVSKPSKSNEVKVSKPKVVSNKNGPKTAWVPKSN